MSYVCCYINCIRIKQDYQMSGIFLICSDYINQAIVLRSQVITFRQHKKFMMLNDIKRNGLANSMNVIKEFIRIHYTPPIVVNCVRPFLFTEI